MNRVVNATVISNYAAVVRLDILQIAAGPLYLPVEVYDELVAGRLAGYEYYDHIEASIAPFAHGGWLHLVAMTDEETRLSITLPGNLHSGERACLSMARQRRWGLLTDDRSARRQAQTWQIPLSGTLGVLLLSVQDGVITMSEGNAVLGQMTSRANYRSLVSDLRQLLD